MNLPLGDCHWTSLMISQHWFRRWLGADRQEAITWTNVVQDPRRFVAAMSSVNIRGRGTPEAPLTNID